MTYIVSVMLFSLIGTILIETILALILKVKELKDILNIVLVNILTNPLVVSIPLLIASIFNKYYSKLSLYILEIITVIVEGYIYNKNLKYKKINGYLLSFILNLTSFLLGKILLSII